jgi:hypothetical protein
MSPRLVAAVAALAAVYLTCGGLIASLVGGGAGCTTLPGPDSSMPAGQLGTPLRVRRGLHRRPLRQPRPPMRLLHIDYLEPAVGPGS